MSDLISRQDAIDSLECINGVKEVLESLPSLEPPIMEKCYVCPHCDNCNVKDDGTIEHPQSQWIPCSERLPEERDSIFAKFKGTQKWADAMCEKISENVLVTTEFEDGTRRTEVAYTADGNWRFDNRICKRNVIAWKPLPTPC